MHSKKMFTENEFLILKVLWDAKEPLSRQRILECTVGQEINHTSFHFAINNLIEKGYVGVAGFERCGTNYGRTYTAVKSREDFILKLVSNTQPVESEEDCVAELMIAFVQRGRISEKTIEKLEAMLADHRRVLEQERATAKACQQE